MYYHEHYGDHDYDDCRRDYDFYHIHYDCYCNYCFCHIHCGCYFYGAHYLHRHCDYHCIDDLIILGLRANSMIPAIIHKIPAKKLEVSNAITPTINKMIPAILDFY